MAESAPLFDLLDDTARRDVLTAARRRKFKRGEVIFHEGDVGDALHIVDKGHVAVRVTTPLGDVATLTVLGPGSCLGEGALLAADSIRSASAIAVESAETRSISGEAFEELRRTNPSVERFLTEVLAAQVRRLTELLLEALYVPAEKRILRRLGALCDGYRTDGGPVVIPITQDDLATMAGTSRPTANRVLQTAQDDGLLELTRGRVTVVDESGVARAGR